MKRPTLLILITLGLALNVADAQERQRAQTIKAQSATTAQQIKPLKDLVRNVEAQDVGVCLKGKKARLINRLSETKTCDSVIWVAARNWSAIQRELIDQSPASTLTAGKNAELSCSSCSGICQIIAWFSGGSSYEGVDAGGGMTPSQCVDAITKICEGGASRYFFSAHCGN